MENLTFGEHWEVYPKKFDGHSFFVRFDTAVGNLNENVRKQYPHIIELLIPFIESNENGFPSPSEVERLNEIEDNFSCGAYNVRLIGVLTGGNCRRFVFSCYGTDDDIKNIVQTLMGYNKNTEFSHKVFLNDNFGYYDHMIAPSVYDNSWIMNRHVCDNLEKDGETFNKPRDIDFFCYFSSIEHMQNVADKLCGQGFREINREKKEGGEYMLHLSLEGIPSLPWINDITNGILDLLEGTDGYFDGWGSPIIKE